jgi:hypothetical protein
VRSASGVTMNLRRRVTMRGNVSFGCFSSQELSNLHVFSCDMLETRKHMFG